MHSILFRALADTSLYPDEGPQVLKFPNNFATLSDGEQTLIKRQARKSALLQLYLLETKQKNPAMTRVFELDYGRTRCDVIKFGTDTWDGDIIAFRESLLNVVR